MHISSSWREAVRSAADIVRMAVLRSAILWWALQLKAVERRHIWTNSLLRLLGRPRIVSAIRASRCFYCSALLTAEAVSAAGPRWVRVCKRSRRTGERLHRASATRSPWVDCRRSEDYAQHVKRRVCLLATCISTRSTATTAAVPCSTADRTRYIMRWKWAITRSFYLYISDIPTIRNHHSDHYHRQSGLW